MPTILANTALIRRRLGNPLVDSPSDNTITEFLVDNLMAHQSSLVNTRNHWSVYHWPLQVSSGVEDYVVSASDFGRPFLVYSIDPTDTYHWRREVPFSLMQDADRRYQGPQQSQSAYEWSAAEVVFYRVGQQWYVRPVPIPGASAQYEVWYETNYNYASTSDTVGLEAFHNLIRVQTALSALPHVAWRDCSPMQNEKAWQMRTSAMTISLARDEARYQKQFNDYRAQSSRDGVSTKLGYSPDYDSDSGIGVGTMINGYGI